MWKNEILVKNWNFGEKIEIVVKNWNFGEKLKSWSKIEISVKKWNFGQKLRIFKLKFLTEIEILFKKLKNLFNSNFIVYCLKLYV